MMGGQVERIKEWKGRGCGSRREHGGVGLGPKLSGSNTDSLGQTLGTLTGSSKVRTKGLKRISEDTPDQWIPDLDPA